MSVYGKRLYGQVDRVPGFCYVSTMFFHLNYVPLFPTGTYIVIDGSDNGDTFNGKKTSLSFKSIAVGYLRGWLGLAAVFGFAVSGFAGTAFFLGHKDLLPACIGLAAAVGLGWLALLVMRSDSRIALTIQAALFLLSLALVGGSYWAIQRNPALKQAKAHEIGYLPALLVGNGALLVFSLTRLATPASEDRAKQLAELFGMRWSGSSPDGSPKAPAHAPFAANSDSDAKTPSVEIIQCPFCGTRVLPTQDGNCPSCRSIITK